MKSHLLLLSHFWLSTNIQKSPAAAAPKILTINNFSLLNQSQSSCKLLPAYKNYNYHIYCVALLKMHAPVAMITVARLYNLGILEDL